MSQSEKTQGTTRRQFFRTTAAAAAGVALTGCGSDDEDNERVTPVTGSEPWYGSAPEIGDGEVAEQVTTKILVCGCGNTGLVAAVAAAEQGAKPFVIEKNAMSVGIRQWVGVVNSTVQEDAGATIDETEIVNELARYASNHCNQKVIRGWAQESGEAADWLAAILAPAGIKFVAEYDVGNGYHGIFKAYPTHTKFLEPDQNTTVTGTLVDYAESKGAEFRFNTKLVKLIKDETTGRVTGAYAQRSDGKYIEITASSAVLLCTGGYADDHELFEKLNPYAASVTVHAAGFGGSKGDGIKAAIWAGGVKQADPTAMLFDRGAVKPGTAAGRPFGTEALLDGGMFTPASQPWLKVNMSGERFCNEVAPYDWPLYAAGQEKNGTYVCVWDSNYWTQIEAYHTIGCSRMVPSTSTPATGEGWGPQLMDYWIDQYEKLGKLVKANTLDELATELQLPVETFKATVARYNELVAASKDTDFGRPADSLFPVAAGPFYGITIGANLLCTLDGLEINEHGQALDARGEVIEGLYAVGNDSGGFFNANYPELMVGVASCRGWTMARHAVLTALGVA